MKSNWKEETLNLFADIKGGKRLPKGENLTNNKNNHPYIRIKDIGEGKILEINNNYQFVDNEVYEKISRYIVNTDDIIISIVGTIGLVKIIGKTLDKANLTENCVKLTNLKNIDKDYLYYYLISQCGQNEIKKGIVGAVQSKLPIKNICNIVIKYPVDLKEQQKIASILSALDNKIEVNQKINENLEQQAQAIFKSWFVDFEPFGGVMPNDWEISCLKDCCSLISRGITPKYNDESEEIVINQKCIRNHQIDITQARTHTPKKFNEKWLKHLDILINSTGQGTLGRIAQVYFEPEKMTVDSHVTIIRPKNIHTAYYIGCLLLNSENDFVAMAHGSTGQTELPRELVQSYKFILPNDDIIKSFNDIVKPMFKQIIINQNENSTLCKIRDALIPKLMNGEIDVSDINI